MNYTRRGWSIFPCKLHTKQPATEHGFKDASQNPAQIQTWFSTESANIGLACGASGLVVLDFDSPKADFDGGELLELLEEQHPTIEAYTPSKGVHLLYRQRPGLTLTNKKGSLPPGVDVRGDGGYILLAPSDVTYSGKDATDRGLPDGFNGSYRWRPGFSPDEIEAAVIPAFLVDMIVGSQAPAKASKAGGAARDDVIAEFNHTHSIVDLLTAHGYALVRDGRDYARLARPDRDTSSVVVFKAGEPERSYHHSTSDALHTDDHARDAFDVWTQLEHGGDTKQAFAAAKRLQGKWTDAPSIGALPPDPEVHTNGDTPHILPVILLNNRQLSDVLDETMAAIEEHSNRSSPLLYVRGGRLVRLATDENGALRTDLVTPDALLGIMARVARWMHVSQTKDGAIKMVNGNPPALVSRVLCAAAGWDLPVLDGITHGPIFDASGTLHTGTGYNATTRLYHAGAVRLGDTTPTRGNVAAAVALLTDDLFVDFPLDAASRAHAIALAILPFVRPMINGATPLHLATAPQHRAGKSLLVESALYPALGRTPDMTADQSEEAEWAKVLTTKLLSSPSVVVLDNLSAELRSPMLATAISEARLTSRILGSNTEVSAPARWVWAATGRNMTLHEELMLRSVLIRLTPKTERPEERTGFKHANQLEWVAANRDRIVTAIVTIVRNWLENANRKPYAGRAKGRFESWVSTMGGILAAAGIDGFLDNERELRSTSAPEADAFRHFVMAWWESYGSAPVTVSNELFKLASTPDDDKLPPGADLLGEVLGNAKEHGRKVALGRLLKQYSGRVYEQTPRSNNETPRAFQVAMHKDLAPNKAKQWFLAEISAESQTDSAFSTSSGGEFRGVSRSLFQPNVESKLGDHSDHVIVKNPEYGETPRDSQTPRGEDELTSAESTWLEEAEAAE